jgi:hypothetical protein
LGEEPTATADEVGTLEAVATGLEGTVEPIEEARTITETQLAAGDLVWTLMPCQNDLVNSKFEQVADTQAGEGFAEGDKEEMGDFARLE